MKIQTCVVDDELAALGVCCNCKQPFEDDEFYCQVSNRDVLPNGMVWLTCIGCAALLAFRPDSV
jgi:hypothetical protein